MRSLSFILAVAMASVPAAADEMVVANDTEYAINRLLIPATGQDPKVDILNPGQTIDPGRTLSLEYFPDKDGCVFDVWAKFSNETVKSLIAYNACELTDPSNQDKWAIFRD